MLVLGISLIMSVRLLIFIILLYSFVDTVPLIVSNVTLAEWLTRWPAKPFPFGSAGSSPAGDAFFTKRIKYFY